MELWFWLAVASAVAGGVPPFLMKVAAKREYNAELFILFGALSAALVLLPVGTVFLGLGTLNPTLLALALFSGFIAAFGGVLRIHALRHIDTTIYFPLIKLFSPLLVIISGVILFNEAFTVVEWLGLVAGLMVPLLLISKQENHRQSNLKIGLIFMLITAVISACVATLNKFNIDLFTEAVLWILAINSVGVLLGSVAQLRYRHSSWSFLVRAVRSADKTLFWMAFFRGLILSTSFGLTLFALAAGGPLGIVYTIVAMYILIPIVLAIIVYKEHWNLQKATAIVLSVGALVLLG